MGIYLHIYSINAEIYAENFPFKSMQTPGHVHVSYND